MFKKFISNIFTIFSFLLFLVFSFNVALAAPNLDNLGKLGGGLSSSSATAMATKGNIKTTKDVPTIINATIGVVLGIFATIILGIIIYAGIKMITSKGKIDTYQEGLKLLKTAIIAMLIILLAYVISNFALGTINYLSNGSL